MTMAIGIPMISCRRQRPDRQPIPANDAARASPMTTSGSHPEMMEMLTERSDHVDELDQRATSLLITIAAVSAPVIAGSGSVTRHAEGAGETAGGLPRRGTETRHRLRRPAVHLGRVD